MNEKTYKITLADGTVIEPLTLNGNNFVSEKEITAEIFDNKLDTVTIESPDGSKEDHKNMELVQVKKYDDGFYFILRDIDPDELEKRELRKQLAAANSDITSLQEALCDVYEATLS